MTALEWFQSSRICAAKTCVQEAGDVLFVPDAEVHSTLNLGNESIAVAQAFCHGLLEWSEDDEEGYPDVVAGDFESSRASLRQLMAYDVPAAAVAVGRMPPSPAISSGNSSGPSPSTGGTQEAGSTS